MDFSGNQSGQDGLALDSSKLSELSELKDVLQDYREWVTLLASNEPAAASSMQQKLRTFRSSRVSNDYRVFFQVNPAALPAQNKFFIEFQPEKQPGESGGVIRIPEPDGLQFALDHLERLKQLRQDTLHLDGSYGTVRSTVSALRDQVVPELVASKPFAYAHLAIWVLIVIVLLFVLLAVGRLLVGIFFGVMDRL